MGMRSRHRALCVFVICLFVFAGGPALAQSPAPSPIVEGSSLRLMTYNTHHGSGNEACEDPETPEGQIPDADCALNLERVADVIAGEDPDIVALQEVDRFWARSGNADQPAEYARLLTMNQCYAANLSHDPDRDSDVQHEYGVLVLSKLEIKSCTNTLLPNIGGEEQRGLLDVRVDVPGVGEVAILNTHLDAHDAEIRLAETEAIGDYLDAIQVPVALMGDLNAESGDMELAPLFERLRDGWDMAGQGEGQTIEASPNQEPEKRIDYILVSSGSVVNAISVVRNEASMMASDHYPVVGTVTFGPVISPSPSPQVT